MDLKHLLLVLAACAAPPTLSVSTVRSAISTCSPRAYGAIPDDGIDDTAGLIAAAAAGCTALEAGHYTIVAAPYPRPVYAVDLPTGTDLNGIEGETVIDCVGNAALHDWECLHTAAADVHIHGVRITGDGILGGTTTEHTPLIKVAPGATGFELDHFTCSYPVIAGSARGDCLWIVGYDVDGQRVTGLHVHHGVVESSARAGIAYHSGTTGRIDHITCLDARAPCVDGEGSGGSTMELDHITDIAGPHAASRLTFNVQFDRNDFVHDNHLIGRGIAISGCDGCRFADNEVQLDLVTTDPVVYLAKYTSGLMISDSIITRSASAGPGLLLRVTQKVTTPWNVALDDVQLVQHTTGAAIQTLGIAPPADAPPGPPAPFGFALRHVTASTDLAALLWDAEGTGSAADGSGGTRTSGLVIEHSTFAGPWSQVLAVSGSYAGTGWLSITDSSAPAAAHGLVCSSVVPSSSSRGVLGPLTYLRNTMPAPSCAGVPPP